MYGIDIYKKQKPEGPESHCRRQMANASRDRKRKFFDDSRFESYMREVEDQTIRIQMSEVRLRDANALLTMQIGKDLSEGNAILANHGNGRFEEWVKAKFTMSVRTAQQKMKAYEAFKDKDRATLARFDVTALYLLSEDATPAEAVDKAFAMAAADSIITNAVAKNIVDGILKRFQAGGQEEPVSDDSPPVPDKVESPSTFVHVEWFIKKKASPQECERIIDLALERLKPPKKPAFRSI